MARNLATLKNGIKAISESPPTSFVEAGTRWADAYAAYASAAQSPMGGAPLGVAAAKPVLASALAAAFAGGVIPATTAAAMDAAFTAFWLTPPMTFVGVPPGAVTAVGAGTLVAALIAAAAANLASQADADGAAASMAAAIHAHASTVIVTHPVVPTPLIGPIL